MAISLDRPEDRWIEDGVLAALAGLAFAAQIVILDSEASVPNSCRTSTPTLMIAADDL